MKLYFKDCCGNKRVIAEPKTENEAIDTIQKFCDERNFKIYYMRWWDKNGVRTYDVGSHSEFFLLDFEE